ALLSPGVFMYALRPSLSAAALVLVTSGALAQQPQATNSSASARTVAAKQLTPADLKAWKTIRSPVVSNDGKWFAYVLAPNEGDATVVVRQTADGATEQHFPIGEPPAAAGNPFGAAPSTTLAISGDSRFVAFSIYPTQREAKRLRQQRRSVQNKVSLLNLATGQKTEFDKIRRFAFSGDRPQVIALYGYGAETPGGAPNGGPAGGAGGPGGTAAPAAGRVESADLLVVTLATGSVINIGN